MTTSAESLDVQSVLSRVAERARQSGLFGTVLVEGGVLSCQARNAAAPAFYRVVPDGRDVWVALVTPDRYLSQSIELDLVHTGDKLPDLLQDELIDLDYPTPVPLPVEHFRDAAKLFTFRSRVPQEDLRQGEEEAVRRVWLLLQAYQACFVRLGDMDVGEEG
jgi:hypothetical protein